MTDVMKANRFPLIAIVLAGVLVSCSKTEPAPEEPETGKWQVCIPAAINQDPDTRAVVYDASNKRLSAEFRVKTHIYVFKNGSVDSYALKPDKDGPSANLIGSLNGDYAEGDELLLAYGTKSDGSYSFTGQTGGNVHNGDLDGFDFAVAAVTVTGASDGSITTTPASFHSLQSMYKFTFLDDANNNVLVTKLTVSTKCNDLITDSGILGTTETVKGAVTVDIADGVDAIPTGEVWMALSKASDCADTFYFSAIDKETNSYVGTLDVAKGVIQNGKFYTATIVLTPESKKDVTITVNTHSPLILKPDDVFSISASTRDSDGNPVPVKFRSNDTGVATVGEAVGNVKAVAVGKTTITIYTEETDEQKPATYKDESGDEFVVKVTNATQYPVVMVEGTATAEPFELTVTTDSDGDISYSVVPQDAATVGEPVAADAPSGKKAYTYLITPVPSAVSVPTEVTITFSTAETDTFFEGSGEFNFTLKPEETT